MPTCCIKGCDSKTKGIRKSLKNINHDRKIGFHNFPKSTTQRQAWIEVLGIQDPNIPKHRKICTKHFKESDIDCSSPNVILLRSNAVPSLYLNGSSDESNISIKNEGLDLENSNSDLSDSALEDTSSSLSQQVLYSPINTLYVYYPQNNVYIGNMTNSVKSEEKVDYEENQITPRFVSRSTSVSPERRFNSPTRQHIRESWQLKVDTYRKQLYAAKRREKEAQKKITHLKNIIECLKKNQFPNEEELNSFSDNDEEYIKELRDHHY